MNFVDLFCGIGGFRIPLEKLGFKCVFSSEIDKYAILTYKENFSIEPSGDITKIQAKDIPLYDILCAGFPCQSFSIAGNRMGLKDKRGNLFFEIVRILKSNQPRFFILENVPALLSSNGGSDFHIIYKNLADIGYKIKYGILNSKYFNVPQNRKRLFIVGFTNETDWFKFQFPLGNLTQKTLKDILEKEPHKKLFISQKNLEIIKNRKEKKGYSGQGQRIYSINGLAITQSAMGGGQGAKTGLYRTKDGVRRLSVRESARLQGFSDDFKFPVSDTQSYKEIGNSVTTHVIYEIGKQLKFL